MKLTDLKRTKAEEKKNSEGVEGASSSGDSYPWGLNINLETESISKLGLDLGRFKVGEKVVIMAETSVSEIRTSERRGKDDKSLTLQIQKLALNQGKSKFGKFNDGQKEGPE